MVMFSVRKWLHSIHGVSSVSNLQYPPPPPTPPPPTMGKSSGQKDLGLTKFMRGKNCLVREKLCVHCKRNVLGSKNILNLINSNSHLYII